MGRHRENQQAANCGFSFIGNANFRTIQIATPRRDASQVGQWPIIWVAAAIA